MDLFSNLAMGFSVVFQPVNLFASLIGVTIGTLVGVLPGLGPAAAISILLPATYKLSPITGIIVLAGIYYGAMYGGSTTSILVNIPGESASVVTTLDGYQMARRGRAGPALGIAAFGSFIAGTFSVIALTFVGPPLARIALKFGPPEYFSLMILGFMILSYLSGGSVLKALMMAALGIFLGTIGQDRMVGTLRFTYGLDVLMDGVGLVPVVMGLFGISEVLINIEKSMKQEIFKTQIKNLLPNRRDWADSFWPIIRGSVLGFFLGILPGGGAIIASFASYAMEKSLSKHPEKFGTGMIEGVAGPESANNSATGGVFVFFLTLGIPCNAVMALIMGALLVQGVRPGPFFIRDYPELFWGIICSMYLGNCLLLVLNLPLIGLWIKILKLRYALLFPLIILFCIIGVYSLNNEISDIYVMLIFGFIGFVMKKFKYDAAPLVLALVLCPLVEDSFRQSLLMSDGSFLIFISRPISLGFMIAAMIAILLNFTPWLRGKVQRALEEEG
jgi:putative tricarboxylic transport membrane protein